MNIEHQPGMFAEGKFPKVVRVVKLWLFSLNFHCQFPFCYVARPPLSRCRLVAAATTTTTNTHRAHFSCSINPIDFSTRRCATKAISSWEFSTFISHSQSVSPSRPTGGKVVADWTADGSQTLKNIPWTFGSKKTHSIREIVSRCDKALLRS